MGFERNRWGLWVLRKKGTAELTEAGRAEDAAMWLGHAEPGRQNQRQCYVRGARNLELGALSMGREEARLHLMQFAAHRVPRSEKRRLVEVAQESPVYCEEYENGRRRCAAMELVREVEGNIRELQGRSRDGPLRLQALHMQQLHNMGAGELIKQRNEARVERSNAERRAVDCTLALEHKRHWRAGQEVLGCSPAAKAWNEATWRWPMLSEAHAVAFSLGRPEFTAERMAMRLLPEQVSDAMLQCGAIGLLTDEDARAFDRTVAAGTSTVERSGLFEMWCGACDTQGLKAEQLVMHRRGATCGDAKSFRLDLYCGVCDRSENMCVRMAAPYAGRIADDDAPVPEEGPVYEASTTMAELVDERLHKLGKPTVDRSTYKVFLHYDGDLYSGGPHGYGGCGKGNKASRTVPAAMAVQQRGPRKRQAAVARMRPRRGKLVAAKLQSASDGAVVLKLKPTADRRKAAVHARRMVRGEANASTEPVLSVAAHATSAADADAMQLDACHVYVDASAGAPEA